jgi:hypothetical protein
MVRTSLRRRGPLVWITKLTSIHADSVKGSKYGGAGARDGGKL